MFKTAMSTAVLIACMVALLAVVGLVLVGNQPASTQGAQTVILPDFEDLLSTRTGRGPTDYATYSKAWELGEQVMQQCLEKAEYEDVTVCCKRTCWTACNEPYDDLCAEKCSNVCQNQASLRMGIQLRAR